jgi:serine/threonine protein kinase
VLDSEGYLRITDLGVARQMREDNHKDTSGTPGYMAPEVICHKNHTFTADYFALGVMGYEFMLGRRPYNGRNRKEIREHILTKQVEVKIDELPYKWSPKAADFINQVHHSVT